MKSRTIIAALLLLAAGLQTASAQSMVVKLKNNKTVVYGISEVDSISFSETTICGWVDLGLPSGTLWATCNVGANTPEEYGNYFAWGETKQKERFDWATYKYCRGTDYTLTKYCTYSDYGYDGFTDGLTELLPEDDAATANWGSEWQMPSIGQMEELFDPNYTTVETVTQNEVSGFKITSLINGNSIFLPVTGDWIGDSWRPDLSSGIYWSRSLYETAPDFATFMYFETETDIIDVEEAIRYYGFAVRPVRVLETPYHWPVKEIYLYGSNIVLNMGETKQVRVSVRPYYAYNKTLAWKSSNTSIATVDSEGNVTGVASGTCTITCRATDGSGVSASFEVTVKQVVTRISLSPTSLSLSIGNSQTLTATVYPDNAANKTLSWESSDTNIATVDQYGKVTAKAKGNCTITCRATDGSGKYATCKVTVLQLVTSIKLSQSSLSMLRDIPQQLTATVLPADASNKEVRWTSSNTNIATVNQQGWVTAKNQGNCIIYCQTIDGSNIKVECQVKVSNYPQYVDLGLPSGTLWATLNIGADNPWETGDHFAWGEKEPNKAVYSFSTYSLCNGSEYSINKYNDTDGKIELEPVDDAASVIWGVDWQIPSSTQRVELMDTRYVTLEWTTQNGVDGLKVKSKKNGSYIFLPAVGGYRSGSQLYYTESAHYWERNLSASSGLHYYWFASSYYISSTKNRYGEDYYRNVGYFIRPVRKQ